MGAPLNSTKVTRPRLEHRPASNPNYSTIRSSIGQQRPIRSIVATSRNQHLATAHWHSGTNDSGVSSNLPQRQSPLSPQADSICSVPMIRSESLPVLTYARLEELYGSLPPDEERRRASDGPSIHTSNVNMSPHRFHEATSMMMASQPQLKRSRVAPPAPAFSTTTVAATVDFGNPFGGSSGCQTDTALGCVSMTRILSPSAEQDSFFAPMEDIDLDLVHAYEGPECHHSAETILHPTSRETPLGEPEVTTPQTRRPESATYHPDAIQSRTISQPSPAQVKPRALSFSQRSSGGLNKPSWSLPATLVTVIPPKRATLRRNSEGNILIQGTGRPIMSFSQPSHLRPHLIE